MNALFQVTSYRRLGSTTIAMAVIASTAGSLSCSLIRLDPVTAEQHKVTAAADEAKTVTLSEPIVWLNAPAHRASKAVRLPQGRYTLEAEDKDYLYFRAPSAIEM